MPLGDNSTLKTNVSAGAPRYLIDKGRPIQNIGTTHPLLRLLLGKETILGDERLGKLVRFSGVKKPKGEKMVANHQAEAIPDRALTRDSSFTTIPRLDRNTIFANSFPYARRIQTWDIPGIDMDRIGHDGYFDPIEGYMNAADQGMFESAAKLLYNEGEGTGATLSRPASLASMISDGQIGTVDGVAYGNTFREDYYKIYGDYDRSLSVNTALRGKVFRGDANTGYGAMSPGRFRMIQATLARNGGRNDVFVANDMLVASWHSLFGKEDNFESKYDPLLQELGSAYLKYNGTIILGDPDCPLATGYMLDLSTFEVFWDGLAPGSRASTTKTRGDVQVRVDYVPGDEDHYVVKRIYDFGWYNRDPRKNAKVLGLSY